MSMPASSPSVIFINGAPASLTLATQLEQQGYRTDVMTPGADIAATILSGNWEFMVLDTATARRLPPGIPLDYPYRILLASAGQPGDAVCALTDCGAVALLETPPHAAVLGALLHNLRRRLGASVLAAGAGQQRRTGDASDVWRLQATHWILTSPGGREVKLTHGETSFIQALSVSPGAAIPRSQLIAAMGHNSDYYDTRRLDTFVSRLRQKVAGACDTPLPLRAIHAFGYAFAAAIGIQD